MELTLYQISDEQRRINAMLEETGGELTPELEEALAITRMEERLVEAMQTFDRPKVEMDTMKLYLRKSERVVIDDENAVPADCKTIKVEVSKTALKAHIKAGEDCGAHLEENQSLQIK